MAHEVLKLAADEARLHFLKGSSYFRDDFPSYINFEPIIKSVVKILGSGSYTDYQSGTKKPHDLQNVNYSFTANKDGKFGWRPFELIHPVIYVSLVNEICKADNWAVIIKRFETFDSGIVKCCSKPLVSTDGKTDKEAQIHNWWLGYEQRSLELSLRFSHLLQSDVTDCYGSLYTHSIPWAIHSLEEAKNKKGDPTLFGNRIDRHIQASRYGQTNGIIQGSALMDLIAELVLGYVDSEVSKKLGSGLDCQILRYRDDYRIFSNSDQIAEHVLKTISDCLRNVGMRLGVEKTSYSTCVVEASVKPDKRAGIDLHDMDFGQAKTIQKKLLRIHAFGRKFPNSGALRRLASEFLERIEKVKGEPDDLLVQVAIVTDIARTSPQAFPAIAGILSHLIQKAKLEDREKIWKSVVQKMRQIPHNGYIEIWLQRVVRPIGMNFESSERICSIVNGNKDSLWNNDWIANKKLIAALDTSKAIVGKPEKLSPAMKSKEIRLFTSNAEFS